MMAQGVCGSAGVGFGNDAFTKSLLNFEGTDGATSVTDEAIGGSGHTWAFSDTAQIDTAQKVFGVSSLLTSGSTDHISTADSADFNTGGADFTAEIRFRLNSLGRQGLFGQLPSNGATAGGANWLEVTAGNKLGSFVGPSAGTALTGATTLSTGVWYHAALIRYGDRYDIYLNGVSDVNATVSGDAVNSSGSMAIGRLGDYNGLYALANFDAWRFSNGIARWTSNFTPPAKAYQ